MSNMGENERKIKTLGDLVDAYRHHLALGSAHSLRAFLPLATALEPLRGQEVTAWSGAQWRAWFEEHCRTLAPSTRNLRYRHLRAMYGYPGRWLDQDLHNPFANGGWKKVAPTAPAPYKPMLSDEQVKGIEDAPRTTRGRLLLRLLAERGRRIGETLAIRAGDFRDLDAGTDDKRVLEFPKTKAGTEQWTVLPEDLAKNLLEYIRKEGLRPEDRLFPISATAARAMVKRAARRQGLDLSPHDLRRSLCSRLDREGIPLNVIQALVGHARGTRITNKHYIAERTAAELASV